MTILQQILTIVACVAATMLTRFLPFAIFGENRPTPKYINYLGKALPSAVFGMLIVYCLKNVEVKNAPHALPEAIAILATIILHKAKGNMLLSIAGGTIIYMVLIRVMLQ